MPRPIRIRDVGFEPEATFFKPAGVPMASLEEVILTFEEVEALRLKEVEGLGQTKAAKKMNVSQPTFFRILSTARKKIADAIVNGKAIRVQGGNYKFIGTTYGPGQGRRGQGRRFRGNIL